MIKKILSALFVCALVSLPALSSSEPNFEIRGKHGLFGHLWAFIHLLGGGDTSKIDTATEIFWRPGSNISLGVRYDLINENNSRPRVLEGQINQHGYWDDFTSNYNSQVFGPQLEYEYPIVSWLKPYTAIGYRYGYEKDSFTRNYKNNQNKDCNITRSGDTKHSYTRGVAGLGFFIANKVTIRIAYGVENRKQVSGQVSYQSSGSGCADYSRFDETNSARKGNHQQVDFDVGFLF
jgi:hypothetical protein